MAQFNKSTFRGLLLPDDNITEGNLSSTHSSYSQAGPLPGVPEPQADTDLNLEASGSQSASKQLRVATQRGGHPDRGGASFRWKNEADAGTLWRGWTQPSAMSGWEPINIGNPLASSGTIEALDPDSATLDDGRIAYVWHRKSISGVTNTYATRFQTVSAAGVFSTAVDVNTTTTAITEGLHPSIVKMPNGRLMVFSYYEDIAQETVQIRVDYSDDDGANWVLASTAALDEAIDVSGSAGAGAAGYDLDERPAAKMRVRYSGGQMIMLICFRANNTSLACRDGVFQYASSDLGFNFQLVETTNGASFNITQAEPVATENGFNVFFLSLAGSNEVVLRRNLASAFVPLSTASNLNGPLFASGFDPGYWSSPTWSDGDLTSTVGEDGILYLISRGGKAATGNKRGDVVINMDRSGGNDLINYYEIMGQGTDFGSLLQGMIYWAQDTNDHPVALSVTAGQGRLALFHNWSASTSTRDNSLAVMWLGGYTTATLGDFDASGEIPRRVCWDYSYLPFDTPDNFAGWTATTSGTSSADVASGYLAVSTTSGRRLYYKSAPGTIAEGIIVYFGVEMVSQSVPVNDEVVVRVTQADGSDEHVADIVIRLATVKVEDNNGGAALGTLSIDTTDPGVEVLAYFKSGKITCYARSRTNAADKQWQQVCSNATVSDGGTGSSEVRFGHLAGSTASSRWYFLQFVSDEWAGGVPYAEGFTNPGDLSGAPLSSYRKTYVDDGVFVRGIDGPTKPGDSWDIDTRYEYPISNVIPGSQPSPAKGWRSTDETEQTIAWTFGGVNRHRELGLYLEGCNWRNANLQAWNGSSWSTIAAIDMASGQTSLAYSQGDTSMFVNPSGSTSPGRYFEMNELVGGVVRVTPSSGSAFSRSITANSAGQWTQEAGHVRATLAMESTPVVLSTTGSLDIWSPRILIVIHNLAQSYKGFRLVIAASQNTPQGYYTIGQMVLGPMHLFSHDYSWGRALSTEPNTEVVTYRDGSRSSFKKASNRRAVSFGWGEGVDVTAIQGATPDPDYVMSTSTSGALPFGYRGDMPSTLNQINAHTAGPNLPIVYCPAIDAGSSGNDTKTIQGMAQIYGRIMSGVSTDSIVGEELSATAGEVLRISNVEIEEEL